MVKIDIVSNDKYKFDFNIKNLTKRIAETIFEIEKLPYDFSFNLSIVSKSYIRKINKLERNVDKETDVLSFPNIPFVKPSSFKRFITKENIDVSIIDINTKTIFLGDILICYQVMMKQAKLYGHSIKREFAFLVAHSILHLLGYDHEIYNDEKKMFDKQEKVLTKLGITR